VGEVRAGEGIRCFVPTPDNASVVAGLQDGTMTQWTAADLAFVKDVKLGDEPIVSLHVSPVGHQVVTMSRDATLRLWETGEGARIVREMRLRTARVGPPLSMSADGQLVAFAATTALGNSVWKVGSSEELPIGGLRSEALSVTFLSGTRIVAAAGADPWVILWDCDQRRELCRLAMEEYKGSSTSGIWAMRASHDGKLLATGTGMGDVQLWDLTKRERVADWRAHDAGIHLLEFSTDDSILASVCVDVGIDDHRGHSEAKIWNCAKVTWSEVERKRRQN
jgi:WD40 repeat protein